MPKIIVVDDDTTNVMLTQMLLELEGYSVIGCTNLAQAYASAAEGIDAFLVDVNLARGESGLELLRAVRAGKTAVAADTAVIITSGDLSRKQEALSLGATSFLLKPYPPDSLPTIIKQALVGARHG
jgi:Response regulator containing CheY-like receiver, AAA-type ATPase, and DNA-binding domains